MHAANTTRIIKPQLAPQDACTITSKQPPVCREDTRVVEFIRKKKDDLEGRIRETYAPVLGQTPEVAAHAERIVTTYSRRTEGKPVLNYHPIAWSESEKHYAFADLFLEPKRTIYAQRITHLELDGFTAVIPSADGVSESGLARTLTFALAGNMSGRFTDAVPAGAIVREPVGKAPFQPSGRMLYPLWEVPVQETYRVDLPATMKDSSKQHSRTLNLRCTTPYVSCGGVFIDAVTGDVYYTRSVFAYFNPANQSDTRVNFDVELLNSQYQAFRQMTQKEAREQAVKNFGPLGNPHIIDHSADQDATGCATIGSIIGMSGGLVGAGIGHMLDTLGRFGEMTLPLGVLGMVGGIMGGMSIGYGIARKWKRDCYVSEHVPKLIEKSHISLGSCKDPRSATLNNKLQITV